MSAVLMPSQGLSSETGLLANAPLHAERVNPDLIEQLGELALASRLKRLSERLMQDSQTVYQVAGIDFVPRWFPVFYFLFENGQQSITDIANALSVTHPAVNQVATELLKHGLIEQVRCGKDKRKRLLSLSAKAHALLPQIQPVWDDFRATLIQLLDEASPALLQSLSRLEKALDEETVLERFQRHYKQRLRESVEIVDYQPELRPYFYEITADWVLKYFGVLEDSELPILTDPKTHLIDKGGCVVFARDKHTGEVLGTCALKRHHDGVYEMIKMGVLPKAQGRQVGRQLAEAIIERARTMGLSQIMLTSNSKLTPALTLYRKLGFRAVPVDAQGALARVDVQMVLDLSMER